MPSLESQNYQSKSFSEDSVGDFGLIFLGKSHKTWQNSEKTDLLTSAEVLTNRNRTSLLLKYSQKIFALDWLLR